MRLLNHLFEQNRSWAEKIKAEFDAMGGLA